MIIWFLLPFRCYIYSQSKVSPAQHSEVILHQQFGKNEGGWAKINCKSHKYILLYIKTILRPFHASRLLPMDFLVET